MLRAALEPLNQPHPGPRNRQPVCVGSRAQTGGKAGGGC
ncbi:MAG: hypothetical protein ACD_10C00335G0002, partial [uncultured bacterium]